MPSLLKAVPDEKAMSLKGDGETIMFRMNSTILKMIQIFLKKKIYPKKQIGKVTFFKRRKAKQSKIFFNNSLSKIYDQIRMLDIDGYVSTCNSTNFFIIS